MSSLKTTILLVLLGAITFSISCDENGDFLLFSVEDDKMLGAQVAEEIESDPSFNLMSRDEYPAAYEYIDAMLTSILNSDEITFKEEFDWNVTLIDDDQTLNAFATPGGQLYVYTGLIYFLDKEDDLAGVLGHEIAHSDQRHGSKQLQRQYGISVLLSILTGGEEGTLKEIVGQIAGTGAILAFSRDAEAEADDYSVRYLADTQYACNGAAAFFEKLLQNQETRQPEFLSTHPSPDNRVEDINTTATELGCSTIVDDGSVNRYLDFRNTLP